MSAAQTHRVCDNFRTKTGCIELLGCGGLSQSTPGKRVFQYLLKIAPDLNFRQIDAVLSRSSSTGLDGIIATNTTVDRSARDGADQGNGGLSGRPLRQRSTKIINYIARATAGKLPIIGVGGIEDAGNGGEKLDAGAVLIQIYTGMIFRGPFLARDSPSPWLMRQR